MMMEGDEETMLIFPREEELGVIERTEPFLVTLQ